ncbi:hypothetical protein MNBD_GAMMA21-2439 [hydrothermal vent metagenome]|uniref:Thioesterase putative domain-containing protein n=1 Tax=hydrothermal vent metagenome TaxID=652676 RepID=A0A3B1AF84_9ZZZZ
MIKLLQNVLHTEIPLTKHIGLSVIEYTESSLTLSAPLENNINHKCTAFGGSLYSVSVLSGWGLIYLLLKNNNLSGHTVIQESNTKFIKPVNTDIIAKCSFSSTDQHNRFIKMYKRKSIARIKLTSIISCGGINSVIFNGSYVVHT